MLQRLRSRFNREEGFTLIELLVVILIIGILAAIAIPSFLNQSNKGEDAEAKSAARTAQTAAETYFTDNGDYDGMTLAALRAIETQIPAAGVTVTETDTGYAITVNSANDERAFSVNRAADGALTYPCTILSGTERGGCPGTGTDPGTWG